MARPFWFRQSDGAGEWTIAEIRAAIQNADLGAPAFGGGFFSSLLQAVERPAPRPDGPHVSHDSAAADAIGQAAGAPPVNGDVPVILPFGPGLFSAARAADIPGRPDGMEDGPFAHRPPIFIEMVTAHDGSDSHLVMKDDDLGAGRLLIVNAARLGAGETMSFDGGHESDGRFFFLGGEADDSFTGGAGNDRIAGHGGADILTGGGGSDRFVYTGAHDSTGPAYDMLTDFDAAADRIDLPGHVAGFAAPIHGGTLATASFDADLGAALGGLGAAQAAWFAPDAGDLAGQTFLGVDANGVAGYQAGEDFVFAIGNGTLVDLTSDPGIFI